MAPDRSGDEPALAPSSPSPTPPHARVAVPLPLPEPLTYAVPPALDPLAVPGSRVRVRVGPRRLVGFVVERTEESPDGVSLRPLEEVLDREPVFPPDLLELAEFVARYYRAPLGEVLRGMLPSDLPPWGHQRVRLTSGGAIAPPRSDDEERVVEALREAGRTSAADLQRRLGLARLPEVLDRMSEDGRIVLESRQGRGARYLAAVELTPGRLEDQLAACGRSPQGRSVVELLSALGRPATVAEITAEAGCTAAVVRRLVKLGLLRRFTQVERLSLDHQALEGRGGGEAIVLRPDQAAACEALGRALASRRYQPFLLRGMTGSGKTEVYLRAAESALSAGRSSLLLVPEIALVPALVREVAARFGRRVAIFHSALASAERHQEWERVRRGEARVVVGPRSALFAPVRDLGLVVVDEEQDPSYKQDSTPRYHGRDVALVRAQRAGATAVLVSATPSLESRLNCEREKLAPLVLTRRAGQGRLPEGILVDLRGEPTTSPRRPGEIVFSGRLREEVERSAAAGEQVILLRNRRGYAPMLLCRACGENHTCEACGVPRTLHRRRGMLLCHYCGSAMPEPTRCPSCSEEALEAIGAGTERVEESFRELFPDLPVDVLDRDAVRRKGGVAAVLARFARGETRVLIGTQMVSKGHHFPDVGLTAVLSADTYLGFADFRAVERTYTLLTQLAGRAGRGERPGRVVIQSYHPDHYAIQAALAHDDLRFAEEEMRFRRVFHYPPYTRMIQLLVRDESRERAEGAAGSVARALEASPLARGVRIAGPAPAPVERLRNQWRFQILLRHPSVRQLHALLDAALPEKPAAELVVDVDPYQLL